MKIKLLITFTLQIINAHYRAAVVEYFPLRNSTLTKDELTVEIVKEYVNLLNRSQPLDIVVFPESTITSDIRTREELFQLSPLIIDKTTPCEQYDTPRFFQDLSCAARTFRTYLIANIVEKSTCKGENCALDNYNLYNTNVVFDRNGTIIAKYRKFHLYRESERNVTKTPDLTTFDTDFGVTFGTFICFDIIFEEPALWLTRNGTQHLLFPAMWYSKAPFLTALQVQNMFAVATNSVLLSSGANNPSVGNGGTGIFIGVNGPEIAEIVAEGGSKIFVGDVPKNIKKVLKTMARKSLEDIDESGAKLDGFRLKRDKFKDFKSVLISEHIKGTYCHDEFCCKFKLRLSQKPTLSQNYYRYRIFVYSGVSSGRGVEICAVAFCKNESISSCGDRIFPYKDIEWASKFEIIEISGIFPISNQKMQYPNTLLSNLEPLDPMSYTWSYDGSKRIISLVEQQERLFTFGIYGRDFTKDN